MAEAGPTKLSRHLSAEGSHRDRCLAQGLVQREKARKRRRLL